MVWFRFTSVWVECTYSASAGHLSNAICCRPLTHTRQVLVVHWCRTGTSRRTVRLTSDTMSLLGGSDISTEGRGVMKRCRKQRVRSPAHANVSFQNICVIYSSSVHVMSSLTADGVGALHGRWYSPPSEKSKHNRSENVCFCLLSQLFSTFNLRSRNRLVVDDRFA